MENRKMGSTLTNFLNHVVFSTKRRSRLITSEIKDHLYPYLGGIIKGEGGIPMSIGGTADHVHILLKSTPTLSFSNLMQKVKGNSSKWLGEQAWYQGAFSWQRGYAAFSVSQSMAEKVDAYIRRQEEHHRKVTFEEELIEILEKHGVQYDKRYLFD
jgi:REP element-mobilizing transposase RayT